MPIDFQNFNSAFSLGDSSAYSVFWDEQEPRYQPLLSKFNQIKNKIKELERVARKEDIDIQKEKNKMRLLEKEIPSSFTTFQAKELQLAYQVYRHTFYCKQIMRKIMKERIIDIIDCGKSVTDSPIIHEAIDQYVRALLSQVSEKHFLPDLKIFSVKFSKISKKVERAEKNFLDMDWNTRTDMTIGDLRAWKKIVLQVVGEAHEKEVNINKENETIEGMVAENTRDNEEARMDPVELYHHIYMCLTHYQQLSRKILKTRLRYRVEYGKSIATNSRMLEAVNFCEKVLLEQLPSKNNLPLHIFIQKMQVISSELERMTQVFLELQRFQVDCHYQFKSA